MMREPGDSFIEYSGDYNTRIGTILTAQWLPHANKYVYSVNWNDGTKIEGYDFDVQDVIHLA